METLFESEFVPGTLQRYKISLKYTQAFLKWKYGTMIEKLKSWILNLYLNASHINCSREEPFTKNWRVRKGKNYGAWIQLDFEKRDKHNNHEVRQFYDTYGYDLKANLEKYNMRDIKEPDLADILMQSLKKGNIHAVAMEKDEGATRMFVETNPQFKTIISTMADFIECQRKNWKNTW